MGLAQLQVGDEALLKLTTSCSHINNMQLQDNKLVTDTGVLFIARNLTELSILGLGYCDSLTDLSLQHLAKFRASTLVSLDATGYQQVRVEVLACLLKQLRNLILDCDIEPYCAEIVPHMKNLHSLLVDCLLSDDCLRLLGQHCKQLQKLGIPCIFQVRPDVAAAAHQSALQAGAGDVHVMYLTEEDSLRKDPAYTEYGLLALVDGLSNLQVLWAADLSKGALGSLLAQRLWQRVRPGLRFVNSQDDFCRNVLDDKAW